MKKLVIRNTKTIRKRVYHYLRELLLNGEISPLQRLIETKIAKEIGTSRTPVREALHILESEGLLESIPRVGYRVKQLTWDEIEEICEIRAVNECLAARWAMKRITPTQLQDLEKNVAASEVEVRQGTPKSFVELDAEFHEILARASGSERLLELCQVLRRHMLRYRIESISREENVLRAIEGHKAILACIKRKHEDGIEMAINKHLEQSKRDIRRYAFLKNRKETARGNQRIKR